MNISGMWRSRGLVLAFATTIGASSGIAAADSKTAPEHAGISCESLTSLALPDTTSTAAQTLPAGQTTILGTTAPGTTSPVFGTFTGTLPVSICRVRGEVACAQAGRERFARARLQDRESTE